MTKENKSESSKETYPTIDEIIAEDKRRAQRKKEIQGSTKQRIKDYIQGLVVMIIVFTIFWGGLYWMSLSDKPEGSETKNSDSGIRQMHYCENVVNTASPNSSKWRDCADYLNEIDREAEINEGENSPRGSGPYDY